MAEGKALRQLIQAGARSGDVGFRAAAEEVIRQERAKRHHLLANDLERLLYGEQAALPGRAQLPRADVPKDERGLELLEMRAPQRELGDVVLSENTRATLERVLLEQNRRDELGTYGLRPAGRMLFCGPPGCGKTTAAEVLASELGLELAVVRFDAVISSYLGETATNLRKVFDYVSKQRMLVLFDEFDTVGKEREDPADHGELKRVVNAFLQLIDAYRGPSILVAATNHQGLLDRALWRRFDEVVFFGMPDLEQVQRLLELKTRAVPSDLSLRDMEFVKRFSAMSHADIERVVARAIKSMVLKRCDLLGVELLVEALREEQERREVTNSDD
jgi:SpoVK/Ycf46/Vps4 family AAA+-type ATPase